MIEQLAFDFAAATAEIRACSHCNATLTAADVGQRRSLCVSCRERAALDRLAERDFIAGRPRRLHRCECLRWQVVMNGDGPARCIKCGRRP